MIRLVLLFFCAILVFLVLIITLIITSSIKLNVEKVYVSNIKNGAKQNRIHKKFLIYLEIYLFGKVKIAKIELDKKLIKKLKVENKIDNLEKDINVIKKVKSLGIIRKLKITIDNFNLNAEIGTEDVTITSFLVMIISTIIRNSHSDVLSIKK